MPKKKAAQAADKEEKSYANSSVFVRMSPAEKDLIERALAAKQKQEPLATWSAGRVMLNLALKWAREVVGEDK